MDRCPPPLNGGPDSFPLGQRAEPRTMMQREDLHGLLPCSSRVIRPWASAAEYVSNAARRL
jgi:hypothetical protein